MLSKNDHDARAMRIVQLVNNLEIGGAERLVVDLASALRSRGHDVAVACLRTGGPLEDVVKEAGIDVCILDKPPGPSMRVLSRLKAYLKKFGADVVHSHNPLVHHYGLMAGRLARIPVIVNTIHGPDNISVRAGFKELLYGAVCQFSDQIIAVCPTAYRTFAQTGFIPERKLMVINNGTRLDAFLRVQPRVQDGRFVFGIVGRLVPVKDHRSLLEAFSLVLRQYPACQLEILGDGPLRGELQRQASALGISANTVFHGYRADVPAFMERIDVSILCSLSEGLPLSVLEAMAAGLPIVGTDVGETKPLVEGANCGWLCAPGEPGELSKAMLRAANATAEERHAMGARARHFAVNSYSLARMVDDYESLFDRLLRNGRRKLTAQV
jgi:glycosyltransferase involved in cell wall biosynthesis